MIFFRRLPVRYFASKAESRTANSSQRLKYTAVVRYDNNVATIPFIGSESEAAMLYERMTRETHKHHVYLMQTDKPSVPSGPYTSLDKVKEALKMDQPETET